ncbi:hypothetical protein P153DRAFT_293105 [Dothidotthia symphoricarpi CBS 119687]|uniref:Uncharacterized protein n=1 Tax=Dothidotthia symphoricarpi CBS 119687 TaxID=1392245 RepID=A0A6A6AAL0_9PLEO|nr:uncharacterized protein P153DRAFT_293105 [Dothidotthia symphoricarpi CBS 119687]KAF2128596.1 hypothetical protein P153DRAFT_293105 [Dothidotthia symphoricarpi CBS 119687]
MGKYTDAEKNACPHGDVRWPPPGEYPDALQLFYEEKGDRKRIFYNLIHDNSTSKAKQWETQVTTTAKAAQEKNKGMHPRMVVTAAFNQKQAVKQISSGPRGTLWLLGEGHEHIWECLKVLQDQAEAGTVRISADNDQRFRLFGVGVKGIKGDILLVSEKVELRKPAD